MDKVVGALALRRGFREPKLSTTVCGGAALLVCLPGLAAAQVVDASSDDSQGVLQEIVVTAQKREEVISKAPIAISAYSGEALVERQVGDLADLSRIAPSLDVGDTFGLNRVYIRGIGLNSVAIGADSSVAVNSDGVSVSRPAAQLMSFFDVDRVEVVGGPQGTLYGRNATGGVINMLSARPTADFKGYVTGQYGNYNDVESTGAVSGPLSPDSGLLGRLAFDVAHHDGYGKNIVNGDDINNEMRYALRGTLAYEPNDNLSARLIAEYEEEHDRDYVTASFGAYPGFTLTGLLPPFNGITSSNVRDIASELDPINKRSNVALTGLLTYKLGNGLALDLITGWRHFKRTNVMDVDLTTASIGEIDYIEDSKQFSQEVRLSYTTDRLEGIVGVYYLHENLSGRTDVPHFGVVIGFPPGPVDRDGQGDTDAYAAFTQWNYSPLEHLRLTAGLRFSDEKRTNGGVYTTPALASLSPLTFTQLTLPISDEKSWRAVTPKFGVDYQLSDDAMVYASVTRGFKSGEFIIGDLNPAVNPEYVWAYEIGAKAALSKRIRGTVALFYNDYKDLQVQKVIGITPVVVNAAAAKIKGVESSLEAALSKSLSLDASLVFLDAKYTDFTSLSPVTLVNENLAGNQLQGSPRWAANLAGKYVINVPGGAFSLHADASYKSKIFFTEFNESNVYQGGTTTANASIDYGPDSSRWLVTLYCKNLTDKDVASTKYISIAQWGNPEVGSLDPPRTYGIRARVNF